MIRDRIRELSPSLEAFVEANRLVTVAVASGRQAWPIVRRLREAFGDGEDDGSDADAPAAADVEHHPKRDAALEALIAGARAVLIGGLARELYLWLAGERSAAEDVLRVGLTQTASRDAAVVTEDLATPAAVSRLEQLLRPWYERTAYGMSSLLYDQAGLTDHRLTDKAVRALLKSSGADIRGIVEETRARVQLVLDNAWLNNWNFARATAALEASGAFSESRARTIARTEIAKASNMAAAWVYSASSNVEAVLISDGDYDEECAARNGEIVSVEAAQNVDLLHPNCTLQLHPVYVGGGLTEAVRPVDGTIEKFAYVMVGLPEDLAAKCLAFGATIDPDDLIGDGLETEPHVTVKYGLLNDDVEAVRSRVKGKVPILTFGPTSVFASGETFSDFDVLKVDVFSRGLEEMHDALNCLPHADSHPDYKPHVTIGYLKPGRAAKYAGRTVLSGGMVGLPVVYVHKDRRREKL